VNAVTAAQISAGAVSADKIAANAVTATKIAADAVVAGKIAANAVDADAIAANSVVAGKIAAGAVSATQIAANAITADKIFANAVTADKIATDAVTANKIAASSIIASKIATGAVTAEKISVSELSAISANLGTIIVDNAHIANLAVSTLKIQDQAVTFPSATQFVGIKSTAKSATTFNTLVTHTVNRVAGIPAQVSATAMMGHSESNGTVNSTRNVLYNAVITVQPPSQPEAILFAFTNMRIMNFNNIGLLMPILSTAAYTGSYTYRFKVQYASGTAFYLVSATPSLMVTELKK